MERETRINDRCWDELTQLLAQPIVAKQSVYREGKTVGIQVTSHPRRGEVAVDLSVSIFLCSTSLPAETEAEEDEGALVAFLEGLEDPDSHIRAAACEALGQLGEPSARPALQAAEHDENSSVRAAAAHALTVLDTPRLHMEDVAGLQVVLWQQVQHLAKPISTHVTDRRGQMRFVNVPVDAVCRLQLLGVRRGEWDKEKETTLQPSLKIPALKRVAGDLSGQSVQLAAQGVRIEPSTLPLTHEMALEDGSLLWTVYRNMQGQVVLEFRSDAPQLQQGWVHFTVMGQSRKEESLDKFIKLMPDTRGILTEKYILSDALSLDQGYQIECEPVPAPLWE
jgi:hypothetical protein